MNSDNECGLLTRRMAPASFFKHAETKKTTHHAHDATLPEKIAQRRAMKACCKKATKITFSNLGLCVLMALYAVAGAYMFMALEQTNEKELCIQVCDWYP